MRIAYFLNAYPRAPHGFIRHEIRALEGRGLRIHRFAMRSDRAALVDPADLEEDRATVHLLDRPRALLASAGAWMLRHPVRALRGLRLVRGKRQIICALQAAELVRRCEALGITHLHAHFGTDPADVAMMARAMGGPRYSLTIHGPEEFDTPLPLRLAEKMHRAAFTVATSSFGQAELRRCGGSRIETVHGGIAPADFVVAPIPAAPHFLAVGRLVDQKGFALLIAAMAALPHARLTLVGEGPLRPQLAAHSLGARVALVGWVTDARMRELLAGATALVLPSLDDGLPTSVMEAMAAGRPVVASAVGGIPELVTPDTGWLVPAGDAAALAAALQAVAATPAHRLEEMGRAARARVIQRHDIDAAAERLEALFAG